MSEFIHRHLGSSPEAREQMATELGFESVEILARTAVPEQIRREQSFELPDALSEDRALARLRTIMAQNKVARSLIGMGYYDCLTPAVIQRNILENPGWYTAYTPYQPEISQGRLEACLNFQTLITELSGLDVANASLLDEATAAAEAMAMCAGGNRNAKRFVVTEGCHPQSIAVLQTRAEPLGIEISVQADPQFEEGDFGLLLQYPDTNGQVDDPSELIARAKAAKVKVVVASDLMALLLLKSPCDLGADIAVGSSQRFGVPLGFGGPHAAWIACTDKLKRKLPGRLVGVSKDADGRPACRLSLQTREQHIRRDKATSNICTAQVLLAVVASMYAVYHGPRGLKAIAERIHSLTSRLAASLQESGRTVRTTCWFDTIRFSAQDGDLQRASDAGFNLRQYPDGDLGVSLDERSSTEEIGQLAEILGATDSGAAESPLADELKRTDEILQQPVFNTYHTETEMMRYLNRLEVRDIALNRSMIPLGSCTMKLNAASEMMPISWPEVNGLHPFAPEDQWAGYRQMITELESWLATCTGFHAVSLQPNAGSQGEYAGLLAIREYHRAAGNGHRDICLIPVSAHGTNPASAVMAGMKVVGVDCDDSGNVDVASLRALAEQHANNLSALMITYPSTHGVFEESVREICEIIHQHGGQVYMDGANLNAQLGLCSPGEIGADVCHLNLHKTYCIPHGGGGPGIGPIGVAEHLAPWLPGHIDFIEGGAGAVSAAPFGSASILTISWMYIAMMGAEGLTEATRTAILNANYIADRLKDSYPVLYRGSSGLVAHECILDLRPFKESAGIEVEDVAKRLMDFGFHAPTMSWPVAGTLMIEPTESESRAELDRFCDAMLTIHAEIMAVQNGQLDAEDNPLKHAPHSADILLSESWSRGYSRVQAAYPADWVRDSKYWPPVSRVDNVYGDRNLVCTCPDVASMTADE